MGQEIKAAPPAPEHTELTEQNKALARISEALCFISCWIQCDGLEHSIALGVRHGLFGQHAECDDSINRIANAIESLREYLQALDASIQDLTDELQKLVAGVQPLIDKL